MEIRQYDDEEIRFSATEETGQPETIQDVEKKQIVKEISMKYSNDKTTVNQTIVEKEI